MHNPVNTAISFVLLVTVVAGSFAYVAATVQPQPWIGFKGTPVTPEIAAAGGLSRQQGFLVVVVEPGSPADKAGLRGADRGVIVGGRQIGVGGDLIIEAGGRQVTGEQDLQEYLSDKQIGNTITLTIVRSGGAATGSGSNNTQQLSMTIEEKPRRPFL